MLLLIYWLILKNINIDYYSFLFVLALCSLFVCFVYLSILCLIFFIAINLLFWISLFIFGGKIIDILCLVTKIDWTLSGNKNDSPKIMINVLIFTNFLHLEIIFLKTRLTNNYNICVNIKKIKNLKKNYKTIRSCNY